MLMCLYRTNKPTTEAGVGLFCQQYRTQELPKPIRLVPSEAVLMGGLTGRGLLRRCLLHIACTDSDSQIDF